MKIIPDSLQDIISFSTSHGFFIRSSDLYGGLDGVFDYGPLGVELKNHLRNAWWKAMVYDRDDIEGLDGALLNHPLLLDYSGHINAFTDPLLNCTDCGANLRADHVSDDQCPLCGSRQLVERGEFNMMFSSNIGINTSDQPNCYLRPATAQNAYACFRYVLESSHQSIPFGIAQAGKAFRNEISPSPFLYRLREFEQMELQYFIPPETDEHWHQYWLEQRLQWWRDQGLSNERLSVDDVAREELAHYSKRTLDIYYRFAEGFDVEIEGIANRTDYDLTSHSQLHARSDLSSYTKLPRNNDTRQVMDAHTPDTDKAFIPWAIEPSAGLDRGVMAILCQAYRTTPNGITLNIKPHLAPIKAAIIKRTGASSDLATQVSQLKQQLLSPLIGRVVIVESDDVEHSVRHHNVIGTPLCIILEDEQAQGTTPLVTVHLRDTDNRVETSLSGAETLFRQIYQLSDAR